MDSGAAVLRDVFTRVFFCLPHVPATSRRALVLTRENLNPETNLDLLLPAAHLVVNEQESPVL